MVGRGIARQGYQIRYNGQTVGAVTSGTYAPYLNKAIGMGFVSAELAEPGTRLEIVIRKRPVPAQVVKRPFYRRPRGRPPERFARPRTTDRRPPIS
jgi:aminomethyltransferase